ncbi:hypothetical protein VT06_13410 [Arsukibacterium sp. MJ3]|uniref:hypothetical protein n=1 Tax=Arsukibacterium sp. MJ3 TaxID=1632859 RepID=UPI00062740E3|nr:hypothetical protein [Arsukibacterium sp. MJ3]KKO48100.1 hypothetical protein VT06_13410 [Arsukibacterium sp. MJ3]
MILSDSITRRSLRLLHAINILHQRGFQNLAIYPYMPRCGLYWQLTLLPLQSLYKSQKNELAYYSFGKLLEAYHSSEFSGNEYFGWADCKSYSAEQLADAIENRLPELMAFCKANNSTYVGWFNSMLTFARAGALPVAFREYSEPPKNGMLSTLKNVVIPLPNVPASLSIRGKDYIRRNYCSTEWRTTDWHEAYHSIIDSIVDCTNIALPKLPEKTSEIFDFGAYWEGAIYWLHQHMNISTFADYLTFLNSPGRFASGAFFMQSFNDQGQLQYLTAFFAKRQIIANRLSSDEEKLYWTQWLKTFELHAKSSYLAEIPNPYFGGDNSLHLGLGLPEAQTRPSYLIFP